MVMSLVASDLYEIRLIIQEEVSRGIEPLQSEIKALRNDIKEIYGMLVELQSSSITDKAFQKLSLEEKLFKLNAELLAAAKQAGITLPRN